MPMRLQCKLQGLMLGGSDRTSLLLLEILELSNVFLTIPILLKLAIFLLFSTKNTTELFKSIKIFMYLLVSINVQ